MVNIPLPRSPTAINVTMAATDTISLLSRGIFGAADLRMAGAAVVTIIRILIKLRHLEFS